MRADPILPWRILDYLAEAGAERDLEGFCRKAFAGLTRLIPPDSAYLVRLDTAGRVLPETVTVGVSEECRSAYLSYYHRLDPIVPHFSPSSWPTHVYWRDYRRTEFHDGFIRPQRLAVSSAIYLRDRWGRPRLFLAIHRHGRARLAEDEIDLIWLLRPHLENLFTSLHTIDELQAELCYIGEAAADCRPLSKREAEVAALLCRGLTANEIAARLMISPLTARKHIENIYAKLRVKSRRELVGRLMGRGGRYEE